MTTYGYIGLGQMGAAMAGRLVGTGAEVTVFDLDADATAALVAKGARAAPSAAGVAAESDIVSICVPAAAHVEAVVTGSASLRDAAVAGQTILVHSTVSPETVRWARSAAEAWGGVVHDACVAGGADAAAAGELVILAGGVTDMSADVVALLGVYGSLLVDAGPVGAGAALKLGVNLMTYAQFAAAAAAFDVAGNAGADPAGLVAAWRHTGQLGRLTESFLGLLSIPPEHIGGAFRASLESTVRIAAKDLELAAALATSGTSRRAVVEALAASMPEVFGLADPPEPSTRE